MESNSSIVELCRTNPKKAINRLAVPTILSMLIMIANSAIDSIWVAFINNDAVTALSFISPLYFIIVGVGIGIGAGVNSIISRFSGEENLKQINNSIIHGFIIMVAISALISGIGFFFLDDITILMGGESVLSYCMDYGLIIFLLNILLIMPYLVSGIYRAKGEIKLATYPFIIITILNMLFDPIFIFHFQLGIFGAASATLFASFIGLTVMLARKFAKKILIPLKLSDFHNDLTIYKSIISVAIPSSLEEILYSVFTILLYYLIITTEGVNEIASYTVAMKFLAFLFVPSMSIGSALITVSGVNYGSKLWTMFNESINYSIKLEFGINIVILVLIFLFTLFSTQIIHFESETIPLINRTNSLVHLLLLYYILMPLGSVASYAFQGVGKGLKALFLTISRESILTLIFAYLFGIVLNMGIFGVYFGMIVGMNLGSIIGFISIQKFNREFKKECGVL